MPVNFDVGADIEKEIASHLSKIVINEQGRLVAAGSLAITVREEIVVRNIDGCVLVLSDRIDLGFLGQKDDSSLSNICFFGTRLWSQREKALVDAKKIQSFSMLRVSREGLSEITDAVMAYVRNWQRFHLVVDMRVLDSAFGAGSPGGFTTRELIYVVQRLRMISSLSSVDVIVTSGSEEVVARIVAEVS